MTVLNNKEANINKDLPFAEKKLGVDLKLTTNNDLELNNFGDMSLIAGVPNAAQAVKIKLLTEPNSNRQHPLIGVEYPIGEKTVEATNLRLDVLRSLTQDDRFDKVQVSVQVDGNVYLINIRLTLLATEIEIPFQYIAQNQ